MQNAVWIALQLLIVVVETLVRLNVTSNQRKARMTGYWIALGAQFLWLIVFLHTKQFYLLPLLAIDGGIWLRGLIRNRHEKD